MTIRIAGSTGLSCLRPTGLDYTVLHPFRVRYYLLREDRDSTSLKLSPKY